MSVQSCQARPPQKSLFQDRLHFKTRGRSRKETIQIIYGHLPPIKVLVREQHLRTQTYLEQRTQQLWFDRNGLKEGLRDWLKTESRMAQNLSMALRRGNTRKSASTITPC